MSENRKPVTWITKNGKHIPIYADKVSDDEKKKSREIKQNEEESGKKEQRELNGLPITQDGALPDKPLRVAEQQKFIQQTLNVSEDEARDIQDAFENWSNHGSSAIHNEVIEKEYEHQSWKTGAENAKLMDKYLNSSNVPKYKGELYRGLTVRQDDARERLDKMLESGVWKESGITAFSYDKEQANLYALPDSFSDKVIVILRNNKHASTIGHLSVGGEEKEALYPSSIKNGIKIVSYKKTPIYVDRFDRKYFRETGKKRYVKKILRYEYEIVLEDE